LFRDVAHSIRSCAANLGAVSLCQQAERLETLPVERFAQNDTAELYGLVEQATRLGQEIRRRLSHWHLKWRRTRAWGQTNWNPTIRQRNDWFDEAEDRHFSPKSIPIYVQNSSPFVVIHWPSTCPCGTGTTCIKIFVVDGKGTPLQFHLPSPLFRTIL
jgi:HPt (histidine-containing phosphotransfer) domain-containing protein